MWFPALGSLGCWFGALSSCWGLSRSFPVAGCFCSGKAAAWKNGERVKGERGKDSPLLEGCPKGGVVGTENGERNDKIDEMDKKDKS
jgi:hypothetical protein